MTIVNIIISVLSNSTLDGVFVAIVLVMLFLIATQSRLEEIVVPLVRFFALCFVFLTPFMLENRVGPFYLGIALIAAVMYLLYHVRRSNNIALVILTLVFDVALVALSGLKIA